MCVDANNFTGEDNVEIAPGRVLDAGAIVWTFSRGGGPGGQNVNKVNSRATLTLELAALENVLPDWAILRLRDQAGSRFADAPPRLIITSTTSRSQLANRRACLMKLRAMVIQALNRPRRRKKTQPSRAAVQRRLDEKRRRSEKKDFRRNPDR